MRHERAPDHGSKVIRVGYNAGGAVIPPKSRRTGYAEGGIAKPVEIPKDPLGINPFSIETEEVTNAESESIGAQPHLGLPERSKSFSRGAGRTTTTGGMPSGGGGGAGQAAPGFAAGGLVETDPKGTVSGFGGVRVSQASGQTPYHGGPSELKAEERSKTGPSRVGYAEGGVVQPETFVTGDTLAGQVQERFNQALETDDKTRRNYDEGGYVDIDDSAAEREAAAAAERERAAEQERQAAVEREAQAAAADIAANAAMTEPPVAEQQQQPTQQGDTGATDLGPGTPFGETAFPSDQDRPLPQDVDPNAVGIEGDPSQAPGQQAQQRQDDWLQQVLNYTHSQFVDPEQQQPPLPVQQQTGYAPSAAVDPTAETVTGAAAPDAQVGPTANQVGTGTGPPPAVTPDQGYGALIGEGVRRVAGDIGSRVSEAVNDPYEVHPLGGRSLIGHALNEGKKSFAEMLRGDRGWTPEEMSRIMDADPRGNHNAAVQQTMDSLQKAGNLDEASRFHQGLRPYHDRHLSLAQAANEARRPDAVATALERLNNFHPNRTDLKVVPTEGGYNLTITPERGPGSPDQLDPPRSWQISQAQMDQLLKTNATQFDSIAANGLANNLDTLTKLVPVDPTAETRTGYQSPEERADPTAETLTPATGIGPLEAVDPTSETLTPGTQTEPPLASGASLAGAAPIAREGELFPGGSGAALANMPIPSSVGPFASSGQPKAPESPQAAKPPADPNQPMYNRANPHPAWKGLNVQDKWDERGRYMQAGHPQVDIKAIDWGPQPYYPQGKPKHGPYVPAAGNIGALRIPPGGAAPKGWDMYHSEDVHNPGDSGWIAVPPGVAPGMKDVVSNTVGGGQVTMRIPEFWDPAKMRYSQEGFSSGERLYPSPTGTQIDSQGRPIPGTGRAIAEQPATITRGGPDFRQSPQANTGNTVPGKDVTQAWAPIRQPAADAAPLPAAGAGPRAAPAAQQPNVPSTNVWPEVPRPGAPAPAVAGEAPVARPAAPAAAPEPAAPAIRAPEQQERGGWRPTYGRGTVGVPPPQDDMSPAAKAAREYPGTSQTRERLQAEQVYRRQAEEAGMKREELRSKEDIARTGAEGKANVAAANNASREAQTALRVQAQRDMNTERVEAANMRQDERNEVKRENMRWLASKAAADIEAKVFNQQGRDVMSTIREKMRQGMPLNDREMAHYDHLLSSARTDKTSYTPRALMPETSATAPAPAAAAPTAAPAPAGTAVNQAAGTAAAGQVPTTPGVVTNPDGTKTINGKTYYHNGQHWIER